MTEKEILGCINDGALTLYTMLGDAPHMNCVNNDCYTIISPKSGEQGAHTVFNVSLEQLTDEKAMEKINEIKGLNLHTWWNIDYSDRIYRILHGQDRLPVIERANDEEVYMALLPSRKPLYNIITKDISVKKVDNPQQFELWANIVNNIYEAGYPIVHPVHHYHHCQSGAMTCYLGFYKGVPASVISALHHDDISALYFLGTLEGFRKKGLARAASSVAVDETFKKGSKIIGSTVWAAAKPLADSLGFEVY